MTTIDPNKKIQRIRTEEEMRKALAAYTLDNVNMSIPPQSYDDDMVLSDVIEELLEARKKLALLEPLRNAWFSENAWEEALKDPGKAFDSMVRPLQPVKTPIRDALKASAARGARA